MVNRGRSPSLGSGRKAAGFGDYRRELNKTSVIHQRLAEKLSGCLTGQAEPEDGTWKNSGMRPEYEFEAPYDATARHEDAGNFLITGVAQVGKLQIRANQALISGKREIPQGVRTLFYPLRRPDASADAEQPLALAGPTKRRVVRRIVKNVLRAEPGLHLLIRVQEGIGQFDLARPRQPEFRRAL